MSNTFGHIFRLSSFGESHGAAVGGVIDSYPAGLHIDLDFIQAQLDRRRPGSTAMGTNRKEADRVEILSGIFEGKSTGAPIAFLVRNSNQHSQDYDSLRNTFRPSHADYTYYNKYGIRDHRGGGRSSARETIARVVAGAFAQLAPENWASASKSLRRASEISPSTKIVFSTARWHKATNCIVPTLPKRPICKP